MLCFKQKTHVASAQNAAVAAPASVSSRQKAELPLPSSGASCLLLADFVNFTFHLKSAHPSSFSILYQILPPFFNLTVFFSLPHIWSLLPFAGDPVPPSPPQQAAMAEQHWTSNGQENGSQNGYSDYGSAYRENGYHGGAAAAAMTAGRRLCVFECFAGKVIK